MCVCREKERERDRKHHLVEQTENLNNMLIANTLCDWTCDFTNSDNMIVMIIVILTYAVYYYASIL